MGRYKVALEKLEKQVAVLSEKYNKSKAHFYFDALMCHIIYGVTPNEYISFGFYGKNHFEKRSFYTARHTKRYDKKFNDPKYREFFWDKEKFNELFKDFVKRDWLYVPNASKEEFEAMIAKHKRLLIKPTSLSSGRGIHTYNNESYEQLVEEKALLEEFIVQHPQMSLLNPSSVNTLRIYTCIDKKGEAHILSCAIRVGGKDSEVDNYHAGGVAYPVDVETGIVPRAGIDMIGNEYLIHPSTGTVVVGFQVPNWQELKQFIYDATKVVPSARMIAWDVAVLENGFEMVEGNYDGNINLLQGLLKKGKLKEIMNYYRK